MAGEPPPTTLWITEELEYRVLADTLRLRTDGTGSRVEITQIDLLTDEQPPAAPQRVEESFGFRVIGSRIEIEYPCPINALCAPPPHLVLHEESGMLEVGSATNPNTRLPLLFHRVGG